MSGPAPSLKVGDKINRWTVHDVANGEALVECECGNIRIKRYYEVKRTKSCGCLMFEAQSTPEVRARKVKDNTTHGESAGYVRGRRATPEYAAWCRIRIVCSPDAVSMFAGRKHDPRWESFEAFLDDVGRRPDVGYTLALVDYNGDYTPSNVEWITKQECAARIMRWMHERGLMHRRRL